MTGVRFYFTFFSFLTFCAVLQKKVFCKPTHLIFFPFYNILLGTGLAETILTTFVFFFSLKDDYIQFRH